MPMRGSQETVEYRNNHCVWGYAAKVLYWRDWTVMGCPTFAGNFP